MTDASVHDSQIFDDVLDDENSGRSVWADSAYRSLNKQEQAANHRRSKVRARVEHIFGDQRTRQRTILIRTKGKVRAAVKIGMMNLVYNMRRLEFLLRPQSARCTG